MTEQASEESKAQTATSSVRLRGSSGAIAGQVTDATGAVIPRVTVRAKNQRTATEFFAATDDEGRFIIGNLPVGFYEVRFDAPGFKACVISEVHVRSSNLTRLDTSLDVGTVSETVTVSAENSFMIEGTNSQMSMTVVKAEFGRTAGAMIQPQISTPRLREYFPETLVWQPSLETDKQGRAQLKFKLADNITTWKMSVIGSTEDGQIGTVEKEIKAFQPFFVELDPPRVLTEGDEISLPLVVRNYLDQTQAVNLEIKPENWFTLLGPGTKAVEVAAGDAARATFDLRATASVKDGKQRITAMGGDAGDAIEKPVTVHPDGEEQTVTASEIITSSGTLVLAIPETLVPNSARAELKLYPNLMAHVAESVEAIMERPHGCGEQTISSTYPSLLLLRNYRKSGQGSPLRGKAEGYLRAGYARLLNYRAESGGFTYWGRGEPDLALTAYALRFLSEARELIPVDDDVINQARAWLIGQQRTDGSWAAEDYGNKLENGKRSALLTAYIARVLAMAEPKGELQAKQVSGTVRGGKPVPSAGQPKPSDSSLALKRALAYLSLRVEEIDEPYLIASYVLAALTAGETEHLQKPVVMLRRLARHDSVASYWLLETNTPFHGWGRAGQVETTALAIQALSGYCGLPSANCDLPDPSNAPDISNAQLINRGVLFLLREKDRYGVWYSTQATINVLDALLDRLVQDVQTATKAAGPGTAEILVNGLSAKSVELPAPNQLVSPLAIDLSQFLRAGTNRIEIRRAQGVSPASVQAVATYYVPWSESKTIPDSKLDTNVSRALRLVTRFDRTESKINDEIACHVEVERAGPGGSGMMLAEIGLPPGANVDRASLEAAMKADGSISQYDILPDRLIVYLWPRAGGVKFDFMFRPRFGLHAQTAPSLVYDYYNPEARAVVAPVRFLVK